MSVDGDAGGTPGGAGAISALDARLAELRADDARRRAALAAAFVVGLALTWFHWVGLVAGGALVGLTRRSLPRAVVAGVVFGLVALGVFVLAAPAMSAGELLALGQPAYVALGSAVALPLLGSLARGVV